MAQGAYKVSTYLHNLFAQRIGGPGYGLQEAPIYKFERIKRAKRAALAAHPGKELLDFGVGEPDSMADAKVVKALAQEASLSENRGYADNGGPRLRAAAAHYMKEVFGVSLDSETEILHSIGSKAALSILPAALIDPGDVVLMTTPGYPVFGTHAAYYGGVVHSLPLTPENKFLPRLDTIPREILNKAKVLVLNYPNNPTGASATPEFFQQVVDFAKKEEIIVIHDAAYTALIFEGQPLSFLSIPGAKDVGLELHTTSKAFNMTGWRCGFVAGNSLLVKAYADVKDNTDSGQFLAVQNASAVAFENPQITRDTATKYSHRMDRLVKILRGAGFAAEKPAGSFFLYTRAPRSASGAKSQTFPNGESFSKWLIEEQLVSTVPWDEAGAYVRFSVTFTAKDNKDEDRVLADLSARLQPYQFQF
jgi:LL-diaminopimelate aminotransferase